MFKDRVVNLVKTDCEGFHNLGRVVLLGESVNKIHKERFVL